MYLASGLLLGFASSPTCPSNAHEIRLGSRHGFNLAALVGLGAVTGDAVVLIAVLLGMLSLLQMWPVLGDFLWIVGGLVLLHVARGSIIEARRSGSWIDESNPANVLNHREGSLKAFWTGFAITAFNPYTALWWVGLLGPIHEANGTVPVAFSFAVLLGGLAWFVGLAGLLHFARAWLSQAVWKWILTTSGLAVGAYGVYFLWQGAKAIYTLFT
jgi:L-lysine exporter family protein LysE/ArgO